MKTFICSLLLSLLFFGVQAQISTLEASKGLVTRVAGKQALQFILEEIDSENNKDVFEIESKGDKIVLRGNNPISIASALNWYLKNYCHVQVSWNNLRPTLPVKLPTINKIERHFTTYDYRSYLNYCTFSYTMAWYDWKRWEQEIDWMAMHGVNMPLAITGQESVWYETLKKFNMSDPEIREFLVGPGFFAWQYMTNIESWAGPLPKSWIDNSVVLSKQILARERELGMKPILQGFTGCVPIKLKEKFPQADIVVKPFWLGYVKPGTAQLDPLDPLFDKMAQVFMEEQKKLMGNDHFYAVDPFHEGQPPKNYGGYLELVGKKLYDVTVANDPKAILVMQSWSLREKIAKAIPNGKLLVLDLNTTKYKKNDAFWGNPWVAGVIHNYGGNPGMGGNINGIMKSLAANEHGAEFKNVSGIGYFMEATEHNPALYEAATEMTWRQSAPDTNQWLKDYAVARYSIKEQNTQTAWDILSKTAYGVKRIEVNMESAIASRPALFVQQSSSNNGFNSDYNYDFIKLWPAADAMLKAPKKLRTHPNYQYDLIDITRQCLSDLAIPLQKKVADAYKKGDKAEFKKLAAQYLDLLVDVDDLLGTNKNFMLGRWIQGARDKGTTIEEKDLYEYNARLLVTVWGPDDKRAELFDYSNRQWNGLIKDYYYARWKTFFTYLESELEKPQAERFVDVPKDQQIYGRPRNQSNDFYKKLSQWEYDWCKNTKTFQANPKGDTFEITSKLYKKWYPVATVLEVI